VAHEFTGATVIDRPIEEVFAFLADGTNDPKFSPRVLEIHKAGGGPVGVGTVFESKVKDAGMTTTRRFELTEFVEPRRSAGPSVPRTWSPFRLAATTSSVWVTPKPGLRFTTPLRATVLAS
jgi:hypothetical protein